MTTWIEGTAKVSVAEILRRLSNKMIESGLITAVEGNQIADGQFYIRIQKIPATTHISINGVSYQIYEQVTEDEIRDLIHEH